MTSTQPAGDIAEHHLDADTPVTRIGYGAMQLAGPGVWGRPDDPGNAVAVLREAVALASATGTDSATLLAALGKGTARSWVAEHWDFLTDGWAASQPGGAEAVADIVRKDLDGATKAAAEARVDAPFAELAARLMPPALAKQLRHEEGRQ